jgi:hypothetical protein
LNPQSVLSVKHQRKMEKTFWNQRRRTPTTFLMPCIAVVALLALLTPTSPPQTPFNTATEAPQTAFQHGEELVYKLYYNLNFVWIPAGEVTFKVEDSGTQYHLSATGRTYGSYEWFFKVRDQYDTYLDKKTMLPTLAQRILNEGKYKLYDRVVFDQANKKATFERGNNPQSIDNRGNLSFNAPMHDILSIIYYMRTNNFDVMKTGDEFPVNVLLDEEHHALKVALQSKQVKDVKDNGKYATLCLTPQLVGGQVFKEGSKMHIWASDDVNHLPLMIESPLSVGAVKAVLKSSKGLRAPLKPAK